VNKKKLTGWLAAFAGIAAAIVATTGGLNKPAPRPSDGPPPVSAPMGYLAVWVSDGARPIEGAAVLAEGLPALPAGANADGWTGVAAPFGGYIVRVSAPNFHPAERAVNVAGHTDLRIALEREAAPALPVRIDGRFWITDAGAFRPLFQSGLTLLVRGPPERAAFLDATRALGFNGIRVFAGALRWAGQSAEHARATLPTLLDEAAARGLYVYVSAITDSRDGGYDVEAHLRQVAAIVAQHPNGLLEVANEIGHPTQSDRVNDQPWLLAVARRVIPAGVSWALGAPIGTDEPDELGRYRGDGGLFNTAHLDRGRDKWNQVRRLREIEAISAATRRPAMSGEPIGADEWMGGATGTRQRRNDPEFFFTLGALSRGFELGTVFHSQAGLDGQLLGPVQRECAEAFLAGWRALNTTDRLTFVNAGWPGSPVASANFNHNGIVRAYSYVSGHRGWTVLLGINGDPGVRWGGGWSPVGVVAERPGVQIISITKGQ